MHLAGCISLRKRSISIALLASTSAGRGSAHATSTSETSRTASRVSSSVWTASRKTFIPLTLGKEPGQELLVLGQSAPAGATGLHMYQPDLQ
jgi:hypothetical protein